MSRKSINTRDWLHIFYVMITDYFPVTKNMPRTSTKRKRTSTKTGKVKSKKFKVNYKKLKYLKKNAYRKKNNRIINVKNDTEKYVKVNYKQKVSKKQQRIINRRFQNGYSPFIKTITNVKQSTFDDPKSVIWIWRCNNTSTFVEDVFKSFPNESASSGATSTDPTAGLYTRSSDQSVYFSQFTYKYEILNPTNYDMNLVIYDIVYKNNINGDCGNGAYENVNITPSGSSKTPINFMYKWPDSVSSSSYYKLASPTNMNINSINLNPTDSYRFNINCKIVRRHKYRLQPGATMTYIFNHKPKFLMNRGYFYGSDISWNSYNCALRNITSGCLFKVWGQIAGTGADGANDGNKVTSLPGRITIKEDFIAKWYCMDNKYSYKFNSDNTWLPTSTELATLEVINSESIKRNEEMDTDNTNNNEVTVLQ